MRLVKVSMERKDHLVTHSGCEHSWPCFGKPAIIFHDRGKIFTSERARQVLVKQRYGTQVGLYALLTALSALGSISAALWLGHFKRLRRRGPLTYGEWLVASLMLLVVGLPLSVAGVSLPFFVQGAALAALGLTWMNTLQEFVPTDRLGRVASIDLLVSSGLVSIGYGLAGLAADRLGASLVFVLGGAISAFVIALALLHPAIRAVD